MSDKKMKRDDLGNRMKTFYEQIPKIRLMRRTPVVIRIDGKAFHTFTRGFKRPFDDVLIKTMQETAKYLCENIQGCQLAYTESDEISLLLIDYQRFETSAWFDYEIQKMCSISASMATMAFNRIFSETVSDLKVDNTKPMDRYFEVAYSGAMFDARVFNIPREEATNYFYWRQLDASRNSIQMVGQANFSHRELQHKSCNDIQDMLMTQKGINWNDFPTYQKRGSCVVKENYFQSCEDGKFIKLPAGCSDPYEDEESESGIWRSCWIIDKDIPIFKGEGREYIERFVNVGEV
jgi:tRNA(His) 5'-end guanylyltransferase